jgi:hypothetical protein
MCYDYCDEITLKVSEVCVDLLLPVTNNVALFDCLGMGFFIFILHLFRCCSFPLLSCHIKVSLIGIFPYYLVRTMNDARSKFTI